MTRQFRNIISLFLSIGFACLISACSNSDEVAYANYAEITTNSEEYWNTKVDYLPLDDSEYSYAGIPRIVIETANHQEIKDRETEIPAKLQIWGEKAPESEVMDLTIKGRGNTTWNYPKKPYAIKFEKKQAFLGMPKAKKWVMLANYRDRTLIRNALAFEIARQTSQEWVPQGKFVDVFLNNKFIGNYYICEKIEIKENRLNLDTNAFLLEFDINYDEEYKFKSTYKNLPINIKYPHKISDEKLEYIRNYIDTIECALYGKFKNIDIQKYINFQSLASFWIVQEVTQNSEATNPKSVYAYKDTILNFGPIWDFDWQTYVFWRKDLILKNSLWLDSLKESNLFKKTLLNEWKNSKKALYNLTNFIDSLANYTYHSNENNIKIWPITITTYLAGDEQDSFYTSIEKIKKAYLKRLDQLEILFGDADE